MSQTDKNENFATLLWIDCEMSGLDPASDKILEIAVILTDDHLEQTIEGPSLAIKVDDEIIKNMDEWNTKTHTESGLVDLCASGVSIQEAEKAIIEFIGAKQKPITNLELCGNSVWHDLFFLRKEMPTLCNTQIRAVPVLDVSSIAFNESLINPDYKAYKRTEPTVQWTTSRNPSQNFGTCATCTGNEVAWMPP